MCQARPSDNRVAVPPTQPSRRRRRPMPLASGLLAWLLSVAAVGAEGSLDQPDHAAKLAAAEQALAASTGALARADAMSAVVDALRGLDRGQEDRTLELARQALIVREAELPPEAIEIVESLLRLGRVYISRNEFPSAIAAFERALASLAQDSGANDSLRFELQAALGEALLQIGRLPDARDMLRAALESETRSERAPDRWGFRARLMLTYAYSFSRQFEPGLEASNETLDLAQRLFGPSDPRLADALAAKATLLRFKGDWHEARQLLERAISIHEMNSDAPSRTLALRYVDLGGVLERLGDYPAALASLDTAIAILAKLSVTDHVITMAAHKRKGNLAYVIGDNAAALEHLVQAEASSSEAYPEGHLNRANILSDLGDVYREIGELDRAIAYQEQAVKHAESLPAEPPPAASGILHLHLGQTYLEAGRVGKAESAMRQALALLEMGLDETHPQLLGARLTYGSALADLGRLGEAERLLSDVADTRRRTLGVSNRYTAGAYHELSKVQARLGKTEAAFASAATGANGQREHLRNNARGFDDDTALLHTSDWGLGLDLLLTLAIDAESREFERAAWGQVVKSRALVMDELSLARRMLSQSEDSDVQPFLEAHSLALEAANLESVFAGLPEGAALVAYVRYEHGIDEGVASYLAFTFQSGASEIELIPLGSAAEIDPLVADWRRSLAAPARRPSSAEWSSVGDRLRQRAFDPVYQTIGTPSYLFVVPDGALQFVNFAALPRDGGGYLIDEAIVFHTLSAERELGYEYGRYPEGEPTLLALGAPDYDRADARQAAHLADSYRGPRAACAAMAGASFVPLPEAKAEVALVADLWREGSATVLTDAAATESAFKALAPRHRVLHLATHGFFLGDECRDELQGRGIGGIAPAQSAPASPLLLSGLALAGANRSASPDGEDGILTAEEVAALNLQRVEWAVLSACDTGIGTVQNGEGVLGLRRAFQIAGAQTTIMSLWPVRDEVARDWMTVLYTERKTRGADTATAVTRASRTLLERLRTAETDTHPSLWAPFVASGNWR